MHASIFHRCWTTRVYDHRYLGPLPKSSAGSQHVAILIDHYSISACAIPTAKITSMHFATILFDIWVLPYEIPKYVLIDKSRQFFSKCFIVVCLLSYRRQLKTTTSQLQTKGQVSGITEQSAQDFIILFANIRRIGTRIYSPSSMRIACRRIERQERPLSMRIYYKKFHQQPPSTSQLALQATCRVTGHYDI